MNNRNRRNHSARENENFDDLLVFGYSSRIYPNSDQAEFIDEERHMLACNGDENNKVDRYDCRLLLSSLDFNDVPSCSNEDCPTETLEEDMCEEERYLDLYKKIEQDEKEESDKCIKEKSSIGYNYDYKTKDNKIEDDDSEDEPFESPKGIKFPVGLELPQNMKQYHIIERTAVFVVAKGAQMEIVIKAKQRNNLEQFGFLDFDHILYPFYKYLQKLIREKKYTPNPKKEEKEVKRDEEVKLPSSLAQIAQDHASDKESSDDDSDCELHPSLLIGQRAPSQEYKNAVGPKSKPNKAHSPSVTPSSSLNTTNNVYASLFKSLSQVNQNKNADNSDSQDEYINTENKALISDGRLDDPQYREWYQSFYHKPCPWIGPKPLIPPTPDLEPIVNSYAEYIAKNGSELENVLSARPDLQLHFMDPNNIYNSYYHHKIFSVQWNMYYPNDIIPPGVWRVTSAESTMRNSPALPSSSNPQSPKPESPVPMNRRQRRRLLELEKSYVEGKINEPGVIDPIALRTSSEMKNTSTISNTKFEDSINNDNRPTISFTINNQKEEDMKKVGDFDSSLTFDPDINEVVVKKPDDKSSSMSVLEPPPPPPIPNNTQLDRKEKARIFMEKLLNEKRLKKQKDEEERKKLEQETIRKAEMISETINESKRKTEPSKTDGPNISSIDAIINKKISNLLSESGFKEDDKKEDMRSRKNRRDDEHKKKKYRRRSRSSSSSDDERRSRRKRRRRTRSRSRDYRR